MQSACVIKKKTYVQQRAVFSNFVAYIKSFLTSEDLK